MVFKGKVAHETEGPLRERDQWWHLTSVELLSCPKEGAVTAKSDDVVDKWPQLGRESCCDIFRNAEKALVDEVLHLCQEILRQHNIDASVHFLFTPLYKTQKDHKVHEDIIVPRLDKDEELRAMTQLWQNG